MKTIIFDSGPIISLTVNNLLWILKELKQSYGGEFYIPSAVKHELITRPIESKKFKFEALQVLNEIRDETIKVYPQPKELRDLTVELLDLANSCYECSNHNLNIIHYAEMEVIAVALLIKADAVVIDERMMRVIIEDPDSIKRLLNKKFNMPIKLNKANLASFKEKVKGIKIIRSVELATIAYEKKLLEGYLPTRKEVKKPRKMLLQAYLWALKLRGCAISQTEIDDIVKEEL